MSIPKSIHRFARSFALFVFLTLPCLLLAQSYRGSIRGRVVDPSGSVIAGAKVNARNNATGLSRDTLTGIDGIYVLPELPAGEYTVTAQSAGLSPVAQNVTVSILGDEVARLPAAAPADAVGRLK